MRRLIDNARFDPILVVIGALTLRLIYVGQMVSTPIFHGLALDSPLYDRLARQIAGGNWGHKDSTLLPEFYQFFLAAIYAVGGRTTWRRFCSRHCSTPPAAVFSAGLPHARTTGA